MKTLKTTLFGVALSGLTVIGFSACDDKAENAGEKIDEAIEDAGDKIEEAADEVSDEIDDATE